MQPWKTLDQRTLLRDEWIALRADRCALPDGTVIDPYYVLEEKEWIAVFALDEHGRILLVRQYRHAGGIVCSELPGGAVEPGEEALEAARRELREETGFAADDWLPAGTLYANPARQTNRLHVFVARGLRRAGAQRLDRTEDIAARFVEPAQIERMITQGEFAQALHVAAFHLGWRAAFGTTP